MPGKNHLHKFKRKNIGRNNGPDKRVFVVFACVLPNCTYYISKDLVENKLCLCNRCGEPMTMTKEAMGLVNPHCPNCTKRKLKLPDLTEVLKDKGIE